MTNSLFTVVIATCNRPDRLAKALDAVAVAIERTGEAHDVVVADNGVGHPTEPVVEAFAQRVPFPVRYRPSAPLSKAAALNAGIAAARSPWIAFTDDDCLPDPDWLTGAVRYIDSHDVNLFSGKLQAAPVEFRLPRWLKNDELPWSPAFVDYAPLPGNGVLDADERVPFGANIFIKKWVFDTYGGYDEELWDRCGKAALGSEDAEFAIRVRDRGETIGYCAEALVVHPVHPERATLTYYLRHIFHFGVREPFFAADGEHASYGYLLKSGCASLAKSTGNLLVGRSTRCVYHLMDAARDAGEIWGWIRTRRDRQND